MECGGREVRAKHKEPTEAQYLAALAKVRETYGERIGPKEAERLALQYFAECPEDCEPEEKATA